MYGYKCEIIKRVNPIQPGQAFTDKREPQDTLYAF